MKNAIVKLGFCLLFFTAAISAYAGVPGVTISSVTTSPTNSTTVVFDITFTEDVTGFVLADVVLSGAAAAGTGTVTFATTDASHYKVTVPGITAPGNLTASIAAAIAKSVSTTDDNTAATDLTIVFDNVKPSVTVNKHASQADPTAATPIVFTVDFSEDIKTSSFTSTDIKFTGTTTGGGSPTVNATTGIVQDTGDPTIFYVTVDLPGGATTGDVIVSINANDVQDLANNNNNASTSTDNNVHFNGYAPTITNPVVSGITEEHATMGAQITAQGASAVSGRGVYYATHRNVTTADTQDTNGSGTGTFSEEIDLAAETRYWFRGYATNGAGTSLSAEKSFWTLSDQPDPAPTPTATVLSATSIRLDNFPKASALTDAKGYVILKKIGSEPPITDLPDGVHPDSLASILPNALPHDSDLVAVLDDDTNTFDVINLTACTKYYFVVVAFNWDGQHYATTNYRAGGSSFNDVNATTWCSSSDIQTTSTVQQLDYASKQANTIASSTDGLLVYGMKLRDGGSGGDADNQKTELASVKISISRPDLLRKVAYIDGSTVIEMTPAATVTFAIPDNKTLADDDDTNDIGIYATFVNSALIIDQTDIAFDLVEATTRVGTHGGGSDLIALDGGAASVSVTHKINVIASEYEFSGVTPSITPNSNFSLTITAKDGNGWVDKNSGSVTLSQTAGTGTLTSTDGGGLVQSLNNSTGSFTWNQLKFSTASTPGNLKTIKAHQSTGSGVGDEFLTNITVESLGTKVTFGPTANPSTVATQTLCYATTSTATASFWSLNTILIKESDGADFGVGADQTFSLMLPAGFIFDTNVVPVVTPSATADISNSATTMTTANSFVGNNIVRVRYTITGTATADQFTITGLMVKYTSTVSVTNKPILRVGGSATQVKNSDTEDPAVVHGLLSAGNGSAIASFQNAAPIDPVKTAFSRTDAAIILKGFADTGSGAVLAAGVFSGEGVAFDGSNYNFNPTTVSNGTHDITFTFTNTAVGGHSCISTNTKTYSVFSTLIDGLNSSYCRNDSPSDLHEPTTPPPPGTCTTLANPLVFIDSYTSDNYQYQYFNGSTWGLLPDQGHFDPAASYFQNAINIYGGVYVEAYYVNNCSGGLYYLGQIFVRIYSLPVLNINNTDFDYGICNTEDVVTLLPNIMFDNGFDEFTATQWNTSTPANGIDGDAQNGFTFDPKLANTGSTDIKIDLHFKHKDTGVGATQCFNEVVKTINVWGKPVKVNISQVQIRGQFGDASAEFCLTEDLTPWATNPVTNVDHKWHYENDAKLPYEGEEFAIGKNDFGTYVAGAHANYELTQTLHAVYAPPIIFGGPRGRQLYPGCESDGLALTVDILAPTVVKLDASGKTCEGVPLLLSSLHPDITSPIPSVSGTWTTNGTGTFKAQDETTVTATYPDAWYYYPSQADLDNKKFKLTLTSEEPVGPCTSDFKEVDISVTPGVTIDFGQPEFDECAAEKIAVSVTVTGASWTWSELGAGDFDAQTIRKNEATFIPTQTQIDHGDNAVTLTVTTDDPDGSDGPCLTVHKDITLKVHQRPLINAGSDFSICTDDAHDLAQDMEFDLHATVDPTMSSADSWTWSILSSASVTQGDIDDPAALVTTYNPSKVLNDLTSDNPGTVASSFTRPITFRIEAVAVAGNVCDNQTDDITVTIKGTPQTPTPTNPAPYCLGQSVAFISTEVPLPKWYNDISGAAISTGKTLAPAVTPNVEDVVQYWLTQTFDGCESDFAPITVVVNPLPVANFTFANQCFNDIMQFDNHSTIAAPIPTNPVQNRSIVSWEWIFDDGTQTSPGSGAIPAGAFKGTTGTFTQPGHQYSEVGEYDVRLNVLTSDGCAGTYTVPAKVGSIPIAQFTTTMLCADDQTKFTSSSSLPPDEDATATYEWTFDDGNTLMNVKNPGHTYIGVGTYNVILKITTDLQCTNSVMIPTSIFPYVKNFPYIENFESASHGWVAEGQVFDGATSTAETSWGLMTLAGSITADPSNAAGPRFWAAHSTVAPDGKSYFDNERSVLYGPCVDMTNLSRPVIAMDYFSDLEPGGDGAYIEYKIEDANGNGTWERLGDNVAGLDWYKGASIGGLSLLGGVGQPLSQYGWTGLSNGWRTGRFNLDDYANQSRMRFRVVFGSNISTVNTDIYDGFALDYFKLESRNRLVLVENFTSASASGSVAGNSTAFKAFPSAASSAEVVKIEYHTGLPAAAGDLQDPIFTQNPMDPSARASFYGLSAVPRGYIDGYSNLDGSGMFGNANGVITAWADNYYSTESLKTSPIEININTPTITNGVLNVTGTVAATEADLLANRYSLYIAVVEKNVGTDAYVLRKMLPSASGIKVPATAKGSSFTFDQSWSVDKSSLGASPELVAIAFVQSDIVNTDNERPVLQAAFNDNLPVVNYTTGIEIPFLEQTAVYPNPADKIATIELPEPTKTGVEVNIIDQLGRPVIKSAIGIGQRSTSINTSDLSGAVYIVQLKENGVFTTRRLLVTHSHR